MAKVVGKFLKGVVGNTVLKEYRGKQLLIIKPNMPVSSMTAGTKKAAKTFGKASGLAAWIRLSLGNIITKFYDGTMNFRLNTEVLYCLNTAINSETQSFNFQADSFSKLIGFEFNAGSLVKHNFFARPEINTSGTELQITIPQMEIPKDIKFPKNAKVCRILMGTTMIDLTNGRLKVCPSQFIDIPYTYNTSIIPAHSFSFEVEPGCLCITAMSLQYFEKTFAGDFIINTKTFNPAAILYAYIAEGNVNLEHTKKWQAIDFKTEA